MVDFSTLKTVVVERQKKMYVHQGWRIHLEFDVFLVNIESVNREVSRLILRSGVDLA